MGAVLRDKAVHRLLIVEKLLKVTYPSLKDPKLLLNGLEHLFLACANAMGHTLTVSLGKEEDMTFTEKVDIISSHCKNLINQHDINQLEMLKNVALQHRKSPMEFVKGDTVVICSSDYTLFKLTHQQLLDMLTWAQSFVLRLTDERNN